MKEITMTALDSKQFEYLHSITWEDVFEYWRQSEANNPAWVQHYLKKGFSSWEEWRNTTHGPLKGSKLKWSLYQITNPSKTVPTLRGGPFNSWKTRYYNCKNSPRFSELITHPDLQNHKGLEKMVSNFPKETTITGLLANNDIYTIEGMHRCCAFTLAVQQGTPVQTNMKIMLAEYPQVTLPELGENRP